jgi:uncharacterized membrane protein YqhA
MKTLHDLKIRVLAIIAAILSCVLLSIDLDNSKIGTVLTIIACLIWVGLTIYEGLKDKTQKEINDILGITWLEKKTGLNFTEE